MSYTSVSVTVLILLQRGQCQVPINVLDMPYSSSWLIHYASSSSGVQDGVDGRLLQVSSFTAVQTKTQV
jgi:hypothetical protein